MKFDFGTVVCIQTILFNHHEFEKHLALPVDRSAYPYLSILDCISITFSFQYKFVFLHIFYKLCKTIHTEVHRLDSALLLYWLVKFQR